jgi:KipI family sensor histidine kinase inhibitor
MARVPKPLGILALGDLAAYVEFSPKLDLEVNDFVQRFAVVVQEQGMPSLRDVVPALGGLALHFDASFEGDVVEAATQLVDVCLKKGLPDSDEVGRRVEVPVCYEGDFAPDLADIAARTRLSPEEVVKRHSAAEYRVLMIGFAPGHAYMAGLDAKLAVPRRASPRAEVPAGSVAIANDQTVVYPYAIAGGWNVIGRTPLVVFDAFRARPSLFMTGDRVRFLPISKAQFMSFVR